MKPLYIPDVVAMEIVSKRKSSVTDSVAPPRELVSNDFFLGFIVFIFKAYIHV